MKVNKNNRGKYDEPTPRHDQRREAGEFVESDNRINT